MGGASEAKSSPQSQHDMGMRRIIVVPAPPRPPCFSEVEQDAEVRAPRKTDGVCSITAIRILDQ